MSELEAWGIAKRIFIIRGMKVMLDRDLAELYGVPTKALDQAVKRNQGRFPAGFMFRLAVLFIVSPHPQYFHCSLGLENLVDEPMLDVDASRIVAGKISDELFARGRILEGIDAKDRQQIIDTSPKSRGLDILRVLVGIPRENDLPVHQGGLLEHLLTGVFMPLRRDSRIPGTDRR